MNIITYQFSQDEIQALLNNTKDTLIEAINAEHGTKIDPVGYIFIVQTKGCLGRLWDKIKGAPPDDKTNFTLVRVK